MKDEYIFNTTIEYSDESFEPVLEVNSYEFQPNMGDTIISTSITDHGELEGRNNPNQHTISSITDLQQTLQDLAELIGTKASIRLGTKDYWYEHRMEVPKRGELIVYTDYTAIQGESGTVYIPKIKMGDGAVIVAHLPFIGQDIELRIDAHILDTDLHLRYGERQFWNNKVTTLLDTQEEENLIFTTKDIGIIYNS